MTFVGKRYIVSSRVFQSEVAVAKNHDLAARIKYIISQTSSAPPVIVDDL